MRVRVRFTIRSWLRAWVRVRVQVRVRMRVAYGQGCIGVIGVIILDLGTENRASYDQAIKLDLLSGYLTGS